MGAKPTVIFGNRLESRVAATERLPPLRGCSAVFAKFRGLAPTAKLCGRYAAQKRATSKAAPWPIDPFRFGEIVVEKAVREAGQQLTLVAKTLVRFPGRRLWT